MVLAACLVLLPGWSDAPKRDARPQAEWFACDTDAQCAVIFLNCQGWAVVGTRYQLAMERWYVGRNAKLLRNAQCPAANQSGPRPQALCQAHACVAR
ncbi:hypothetical protein [Pseudoxanthomonas composti]|uniref:Uncharacterized protein n=1 Tax=Pseudoxanthomonas composti TaxID=2137479 RepID=A0A4Q1JZQ8_9GAMM|nr:hypothetical protein [Pseudoxanthomonas composti]RXR08804.1 hypothetical protein EPA99_03070 [Pseudoxanthomonas composti]